MAIMEVSFPGGKKVDTTYKGMTVHTDQPEYAGGEGAGPAPFDLFLSSIASCAGFYCLAFCANKDIDIEGMKVTLEPMKNKETKMIETIKLDVTLPDEFPEKYHKALLRSIDLCSVKKHIFNPPEFQVELISE